MKQRTNSPTPRRSRRLIVTFAAAVLGLIAMSTPASAITTEEVITLTKLGIPPAEIIKAIDKDKTVFTLSVGDILNLKKAGVAEPVIKHMLSTKERYGGGTETGGSATPGKTGTTTTPTTGAKELTPAERAERERRMREEAERLMAEKKRAEEAQRKAYAKGVLATGRRLAGVAISISCGNDG